MNSSQGCRKSRTWARNAESGPEMSNLRFLSSKCRIWAQNVESEPVRAFDGFPFQRKIRSGRKALNFRHATKISILVRCDHSGPKYLFASLIESRVITLFFEKKHGRSQKAERRKRADQISSIRRFRVEMDIFGWSHSASFSMLFFQNGIVFSPIKKRCVGAGRQRRRTGFSGPKWSRRTEIPILVAEWKFAYPIQPVFSVSPFGSLKELTEGRHQKPKGIDGRAPPEA